MSMFDRKVEKNIPGTFFMFSGADDSQQSADISNVGTFTLPDPAGQAGGACTSALLQVMYRDEGDQVDDLTWTEVLEQMREKIEDVGLTQIPQLSSSRNFDINETMRFVPEGCRGTKRALLIGVNYVGEEGELSGCHNDVQNMKEFLIDVHGFEREQMLLLLDDGKHHEPTREMIMESLRKLVDVSVAGDVIFLQFSGHGCQLADTDGDEEDGYDEVLIPCDYKENGQIHDDEIYEEFVTKVRKGVTVTALMDCCHSGTAMDLPYVCHPGDSKIHRSKMFSLPTSGQLFPKRKKKARGVAPASQRSNKKPPSSRRGDAGRRGPSSRKKEPEEEEYYDEDGNVQEHDDEEEYEEEYEDYDEDYVNEDAPIQEVVYDNEDDEDFDEDAPPSEKKPKKKKKGIFSAFGRKKK